MIKRSNSIGQAIISENRFRIYPQELILEKEIPDDIHYILYLEKGNVTQSIQVNKSLDKLSVKQEQQDRERKI